MTALDDRPMLIPTPAVMPTQRALVKVTLPPRSCASCTRHDTSRPREHSPVTFTTRGGALAGGTTVWRPVDVWLTEQRARGWDLVGFDPETGEAYLEHGDGRRQHVGPRVTG